MVETKYKRGVLLLVDVVNYTTQSNQLGTEITVQFNKNLEKEIKRLTEEYNGEFIKTIGDALLLFFENEDKFLDFVSRLRDLSRHRQLDLGEFFADLRMAAHMGRFSFEFFEEKISDLIGPGGITVFRIEKYANKHDVVITGTVLDFLDDSLKQKNIDVLHLGREKLKGFDKETALHKLIFPEKDEKITTNLLRLEMETLEKNTKEIPIFGDLYPSISMEKNFINLHINKTRENADDCYPYWYHETGMNRIKEVDGMLEVAGIDLKRERRFIDKSTVSTPPLDVKTLYKEYFRGIILGLPGSGKTTILKYFTYRELKANRGGGKYKEKRTVLFIPCRNIMSYNQWYSIRYNVTRDDEGVFNIETILNYLAYGFLFNREKVEKENKNIEKAEKLVQQAYYNGRLSVLIDGLDEAPSKKIKDKIIASVKALFAECEEAKRKTNRIYLTSRFSEREVYFQGKNAAILQPLFEVRPLDMEQLRQLAGFFYKGKPKLYREFDTIVWQEEIAVKVGGTPLTALLVIAYFEIFRKFDTRYHMYNIIVTFILVQVWKNIKKERFDKDMKAFFKEAKSKVVLKEEKHAQLLYDALSFFCYEHLEKGHVINEEDILGVFEIFAKYLEGDTINPCQNPAVSAELWLNNMKEDHLLITAGANEFVFIHSNVMEYLAARFIVERMVNPNYLEEQFENIDIEKDLEKKNSFFFESEIIPIAVGRSIETGTKLLRFIKRCLYNTENEKIQKIFYQLALRSLSEFESYIDRQYQRQQLNYLHRNLEKEIKANWDAVEWIYKYLADIILSNKKKTLETALEDFKNISTFVRPFFLQNNLDYEKYSDGDSGIVFLREELLYKIIKRELVDAWLKKNREEKEWLFLKTGGLLTINSFQYNPEDKNFKYYREFTGNNLTGFLGSPNLKHNDAVKSVAVSPNGNYIISGSEDKTIKLWESDTGKEIRTFKGHSGWIYSVCFSTDGQYIFSGSYDNTVKLWEIATGREIRTFNGHSNWVSSVCPSPDGKFIISGSWDKTIKLWEIAAGREIYTLKGHDSAVTCVCFSPNGKYIISGSYDNTLKLWDTAARREVRTFKGHKHPVWCICFSKDSKHAISGSKDCTVKLWEVAAGKELRTFKGHGSYVNSVSISIDRKYIISGSSDNTVKIWETATGKEASTFKGHSDVVTSVCFSSNSKKIISGSSDKTVKLWDTTTGREVRIFNGHDHSVWSICFSPDGQKVASASRDSTIKLWDAANGKELRTLKGHGSGITSVCFSDDAKSIISGSSDHTVKLWEAATGREVRTFKGHKSNVNCVNISPGGKFIISGSSDNTIKLWETVKGRELRRFIGHTSNVNSVSFSPHGNSIISGSWDNTVKLWEIASGSAIRNFKAHTAHVNSVGFIPGGKYIISGSADNTVKLWEVYEGQEVKTFSGHSSSVSCVCVSGGGKNIISGSDDYTIKIWDIASGECIRTIELLWIPNDIKENPCQLGCFATANSNGTVTFFDLKEILSTG